MSIKVCLFCSVNALTKSHSYKCTVSTKVDLRLSLSKANWIPDYAKEKLKSSAQLRKSKNNELIITSDKTRSQAKNIQDCYSKLTQIIKDSVAVTKEPDQSTLLRVEQL